MQPFEGLTGPITFDSKGNRINYTIDIHRASSNMPLTKIGVYSSTKGLKIVEETIFRENNHLTIVNRERTRKVVVILVSL